jgi:hypothetical protein
MQLLQPNNKSAKMSLHPPPSREGAREEWNMGRRRRSLARALFDEDFMREAQCQLFSLSLSPSYVASLILTLLFQLKKVRTEREKKRARKRQKRNEYKKN